MTIAGHINSVVEQKAVSGNLVKPMKIVGSFEMGMNQCELKLLDDYVDVASKCGKRVTTVDKKYLNCCCNLIIVY